MLVHINLLLPKNKSHKMNLIFYLHTRSLGFKYETGICNITVYVVCRCISLEIVFASDTSALTRTNSCLRRLKNDRLSSDLNVFFL